MDYNTISSIIEVTTLISIFFGVVFLIFSSINENKTIILFISSIMVLEFLFWTVSKFNWLNSNIYLMPILDFIDLLFLTLIYQKYFLHFSNKKRNTLIVVGAILSVVGTIFNKSIENFQMYLSICFQLLFVSYTLFYFNQLIIEKIKMQRSSLIFNVFGLVLFSVEAIVLLTINYLVNERLDLVAPFWIFRMLLLQLYYLSLIYFGWEIGKTRK